MSHTVISAIAKGELAVTRAETRSPQENEVLIKVHYALISAFDSHQIEDGLSATFPQAVGCAVSGEVIKIGEGAEDAVGLGDTVFALTYPPGDRATQEYVIVQKYSLAKVPENVKPEAAVTLPDNFATAWWTIYHDLGLPLPKSARPVSSLPVNDPITSEPILVWAAGTSVAQNIIQILKLAGYKNIIATASKRSFATTLSSGATHVFDYNDPEVADKIKGAAGHRAIKYAVDPVAFGASLQGIANVVAEEGSRVAILLPIKGGNVKDLNSGGHQYGREIAPDQNPFKKGVKIAYVSVFQYPTDAHLRDNLLPKILPELLASGHILPPPVRLLDSGSFLDRVNEAVALIKTSTLGGERTVVKVDA